MARLAYLDLIGGLAGDMFLAALLDAGLPRKALEEVLAKLPGELSLEVEEVQRHGLRALHVKIRSRAPGSLPQTYVALKQLVEKLPFSKETLAQAQKMIDDLFEAEASVHGRPREEVHLHELSAYDTLADIFGTLEGLRQLGIAELFASPIPLGKGLSSADHGVLPLPAPATLKLLEGLPVYGAPARGETITPTGAVLLKNLVKSFGQPPSFVFERCGYGAGTRDFPEVPNLVRLWLGSREDAPPANSLETVVEIETNLDDHTPEELAHLAEKLREAGALDVGFTPFFMKKGRPGVKLCLLAHPAETFSLIRIIFRETGTLGVRFRETRRLVRDRRLRTLETPWGRVRAKFSGGELLKLEYEDLKKLSLETGIPLRDLRRRIEAWVFHQRNQE